MGSERAAHMFQHVNGHAHRDLSIPVRRLRDCRTGGIELGLSTHCVEQRGVHRRDSYPVVVFSGRIRLRRRSIWATSAGGQRPVRRLPRCGVHTVPPAPSPDIVGELADRSGGQRGAWAWVVPRGLHRPLEGLRHASCPPDSVPRKCAGAFARRSHSDLQRTKGNSDDPRLGFSNGLCSTAIPIAPAALLASLRFHSRPRRLHPRIPKAGAHAASGGVDPARCRRGRTVQGAICRSPAWTANDRRVHRWIDSDPSAP